MEKPSLSQVNTDGLDALKDLWKEIPRNITYFRVEELEIQTLGAGVTIKNTSSSNPSYLTNQPKIISDPSSIKWDYGQETGITLPNINLDNNLSAKWKAFSRLSIFSSPETVCQIQSNQCACLFELVGTYNASRDMVEYSLEPKYALGPGQAFSTNYVTLVSGGVKQDVRALKSNEELSPINFSVFDFKLPTSDTGANEFWDTSQISADDLDKLSELSTIRLSDGSYQTKIKVGKDANISQLSLRLSLSNLFDNSTIIPLIIEGQSNNTISFNISSVDGQIPASTELNPLIYHDCMLYLNYKETTTNSLDICIKSLAPNDIVLITLYPPKHYSKDNAENLVKDYSDISYKVIKSSGSSLTASPQSFNDIPQWSKVSDNSKGYAKYDIVNYQNSYYISKTSNNKNSVQDKDSWKKITILKYSGDPNDYAEFDVVAKLDTSQSMQSLKNKVKDLASYKVKDLQGKSHTLNAFDYSYEVPEDDQILNPLDPISFYNENHICNKFLLSQIESIDIRLARQSKQ